MLEYCITVWYTQMNQAITTAGRCHRPDDALMIFHTITKMGMQPDLTSYNCVIWCMGHAHHIDRAREIFDALCKHHQLRPNSYTYGALFYGFAKAKLYLESLRYLEDMLARDLAPNAVILSSVMEACIAAGQPREAVALLDRLDEFGVTPDVSLVNTIIKACCLAGDMEQAESFAK
jgi:leucine-rich PPR motif-containing protein